MKRHIIHGLADALDRIGATVASLSVIGTWFTDQISAPAGIVGLIAGSLTVLLGVYTKELMRRDMQ